MKLTLGVLSCLDGYMNIAMERTEEYVNGELKHRYGDVFLRGNNGESNLIIILQLTFNLVLYISAVGPRPS